MCKTCNLLFGAKQEMWQMFKQAKIVDKTSKKKLGLENPLQSGTWPRLLQKPVFKIKRSTLGRRCMECASLINIHARMCNAVQNRSWANWTPITVLLVPHDPDSLSNHIKVNRALSKSPFAWHKSISAEMDAKREKTDVDNKEQRQYSEQTFAHVLKEGEEDYDDYSMEELRQFPELGYDENEVEKVVQGLKPALRKKYRELRAFHLLQYRTQGKMLPFSDVVRECMEDRYPGIPGVDSEAVLKARDDLHVAFKQKRAEKETDQSEDTEVDLSLVKQEADGTSSTPFIGKTITEVIDLTEGKEEVVIRVKRNTTLHKALTPEMHEYVQTSGQDEPDEDKVSEHSLGDDEDDFLTDEAVKLLRELSIHDTKGAELKNRAACEEVYMQAISSDKRSTLVSEKLSDDCASTEEFHPILALGYRAFKEAAAARDVEGGRAPRPVPSFHKLAEDFQVATGTLSRQYNEATRYASLRKSPQQIPNSS